MQSKATKLLAVMLSVSLAILIFHVAFKYVSVVAYQEEHLAWFELSNRFDMNDENSVPQWFTLVVWLAIAAGSFLASRLAARRDERWLWNVIAFIALLSSLDDAAAIHESVLGLLHLAVFDEAPATLVRNAWLIILPFVLAGLGWVLFWTARLLPRRTTVLMAVGGVIFIMGAVFIDSVINTVSPRSFMEQGVLAGAEGGLQLVGSIIILYAVADYLERHHHKALAAGLEKISDRSQ